MVQEYLRRLFSLQGKSHRNDVVGGIGSQVLASMAGAQRAGEGIEDNIALALDLTTTGNGQRSAR